MNISESFHVFLSEAPEHSAAWLNAVKEFDQASALDRKTQELAYLAVLAAARLTSGIPFHTKAAKRYGASRDEIIATILVGLPAVGNCVIQSLPIALEAYDEVEPEERKPSTSF